MEGHGEGIEALERGEAFADLSAWRKVEVTGTDARDWLNDLVSADISALRPGETVASLVLSPTGRVRAAFTVAAVEAGYLLLQEPSQPSRVDALLERYVLSAAVVLADSTSQFALFAFPGPAEPPPLDGALILRPSSLGRGVDLLVPADRAEAAMGELRGRFGEASPEDLEAWRVAAGLPKLGVDVTEEDLPQEGALEGAVAFDKGCYLGQEAVAKVRNLGHPRRVLLALRAPGPVAAGEEVLANGTEAGVVTSAVALPEGGAALLAKVRWEARESPLSTSKGLQLSPSG